MRIVRADQQTFVPASHEDPNNPGVMKRVIAARDDILEGRVQMINWARLPAGSSFQRHYHEDMEETFLMVRGDATMTVDGETSRVGPGDAVIVAPGEIHSMTNVGSTVVEYIVIGISLGQDGKTIVVGDENNPNDRR